MAFSWGYGSYYKIVCEAYLRWMVTDFVELIFNCSVITSILYLHHKCAKVRPVEPLGLEGQTLNMLTLNSVEGELEEELEE